MYDELMEQNENETNTKLRLTEAMQKYGKRFKDNKLNILNAPCASGKTYFFNNEFIKNTNNYLETPEYTNLEKKLSRVLYVVDNNMLKDSIINESGEIATKFGKGSLLEGRDFSRLMKQVGEDNGTIKVMTYATLGLLLKDDKNKKRVLDSFSICIMDELQNLFSYAKKFNYKKEDGFIKGAYVAVIDNLDFIYSNITLIGLSGTHNSILNFLDTFKEINDVDYECVFTEEERETLFTYNYEPQYHCYTFNCIKGMDYDKVLKDGHKILIYTNTISKSREYKYWYDLQGIKCEWLCSLNNTREIMHEEDGELIVEEVPIMSKEQLELREMLVTQGRAPDDLTVLIINGGYETGWNLLDERFQICWVDSTNIDTREQARYRIRHDIEVLSCLHVKYDEEGYMLRYSQGEFARALDKNGAFIKVGLGCTKMKRLDEKYIGVKLVGKREELKFLYALRGMNDKRITWGTFKRDMISENYLVESKKNGTYIYEENKKIKKDSRKAVKKMEEVSMLIDWIENDWDMIRIECGTVKDILDMGNRAWARTIENEEFVKYCADNKIVIKQIYGMGMSKYLCKY